MVSLGLSKSIVIAIPYVRNKFVYKMMSHDSEFGRVRKGC